MIALFPSDPLNPRAVDPAFHGEFEAARRAKFRCDLLDLAELESGRVKIREGEGVCHVAATFYRGWMVTPTQYKRLAAALTERETPFYNDLDHYEFTYNFPRWYKRMDIITSESFWIEGLPPDTQAVANLVANTCKGFPQVLKDYLKSQKHYWHEACFIPEPGDVKATKKVIDRFLELQGDSFVGGLVFREFEEFVQLGKTHPQSKFPLIDEYRAFLRHGHVIHLSHMWDREFQPPTTTKGEILNAHEFATAVGRERLADIPFITLDFGRCPGAFVVVELGDGGVSSVPWPDELDVFYASLAATAHSYRH